MYVTSVQPQERRRGDALLLEHCRAIDRLTGGRRPAAERLDEALGPELAHMLLWALSSPQVARREAALAAA